ncbi:MAG TPA: hypothetical protein VMC09_02080 [Anaerolineales bacterium]|nr:hypothetical protein [Anaerolineales bacterium]
MQNPEPQPPSPSGTAAAGSGRVFLCDRCGAVMVERQCKVVCPNCGNRFDCSDLNLNFDELKTVQK